MGWYPRGAFVAFLSATVVLGIDSSTSQTIPSVETHEQSVGAIVKLGGRVTPSEKIREGVEVSLTRETVTDAALSHLASLIDVVKLDLTESAHHRRRTGEPETIEAAAGVESYGYSDHRHWIQTS